VIFNGKVIQEYQNCKYYAAELNLIKVKKVFSAKASQESSDHLKTFKINKG